VTLQRLWAGWRSDYIEGITTGGRTDECLFEALAAMDDDEAMILERTATTFTVMNAFPYTSGHLMAVPLRHVAGLTDLDDDEAAALMAATQRANVAIVGAYAPEGINVGMNIGAASGAGVPGHLHVHLVPRWRGDTNFMTAVAETRVLPESLRHSYEKLRAAFPASTAGGSGAR
jgi:ATP adenylyltransferase